MILSEMHNLVLFWVFVGFFLVIGVVALLAVTGVIKTERQFRKWAVGGLFAGIAGVVFVWAKSELPLDFLVNLEPPAGVAAESFELVSGHYWYHGQSNPDASTRPSGSVELTVGEQVGWWTVKFPYKGVTKAVTLVLTDKSGGLWRVRPFYPNSSRQKLNPNQPPDRESTTSQPISLIASNAFASEKTIKFTNYAKPLRTLYGRTYYQWRVFADEPDQVLKGIAEVQYLLHPTFPDPLQVRTNPGDKFAVEASGWGQFSIEITIKFKDQSTSRQSYYLDFNKKWP